MIEFSLTGKNRKNLIIFIHGLTGDKMTWVNQSGQSFSDLLGGNREIKKKFDIADFIYYSKLLTSTSLKVVNSIVSKIFSGSSKKVKLNLDVDDISDLLLTEIKVKCAGYKSIVFIGHSLGGLIAKATILKAVGDKNIPPIKIFLSLAVPHDGANLASVAYALNKSAQLENLKPLSENVKALNNKWIQTPVEQLPKTIYFQGKYDMVVPNTSSIGYELSAQDVMHLDDDHTSISKPTSVKATLYLAVVKILKDFLDNNEITDVLKIQRLDDENKYNDEIFVLKLLIADVHNRNISSAKNSFYNAEFIRKVIVARNIITLDEFQQLYGLIEGLYNNAFGLLTSGKLLNGNDLITHIHEKIQSEDQTILKSISALSFIHKTGMLHQLANDIGNSIWWEDGHDMDTIENFKQSKNQ
ncbi:putative lipase [Mucilaginibacter daejeonensis]|uniref:ABC-three component system protein n=1 Tax=Mucilaginibacter daejeonensis TaxID=398049 RepID=UPI001D1790D2|nr:ABC-three component system protein [Mucilaginibacter daejeonensis]UEG53558.1 putative lipase [Mucilaginibacter daejeonensis]